MATGKQYSAWLVNSRQELRNGLILPVLILGTLITAVALGNWFGYLFGRIGAIIGTATGVSICLGVAWRFVKGASDIATVTVATDRLVARKQQTAEQEEFLFSELARYRVLTNFRGRASLRLIATNGRQLALRDTASPEFTALIKEFDVSILQYERLSGKRFARINMG